MGTLVATRNTWAALMVMSLMACTAPGRGDSVEQVVEYRAQKRLDLLLDGDFQASMQYTTPAYRSAHDLAYYTRAFAGAPDWVDASVEEVVCTADRCEVSYTLTYTVSRGGFENARSMSERWIRVDDGWYVFLR